MRISVVIVEDEPLNLRSIKANIESADDRFFVVGEASNGADAIELIERTLPDLVVTDIRMPVMDGLKLIEELKIRRIDVEIIILSGYKDFEYARTAMKFGIHDYLLKPLDPEELKPFLSKLYTRYVEEKEQRKKGILYSALTNSINSIVTDNVRSKYFGDANEFYVVHLCSGSYCTFSSNWITPAKDFWLRNDWETLVDKFLSGIGSYWLMDDNQPNEKFLIVMLKTESIIPFRDRIKELYEALLGFHFPITVFTLSSGFSLNNLSVAYQRCKMELKKNLVFGHSSYLIAGSNPDIQQTNRLIDPHLEKVLITYIQNGQTDAYKLGLKRILNLCEKEKYTQYKLDNMLNYLFDILFKISDGVHQSRVSEIKMEKDELISNSTTYSSIFEGIACLFDDFFHESQKHKRKMDDRKTLVERAEAYLCKHYSNPISIQLLAENEGMNLSHFGYIFKKEKCISPMEYVINLRIERAKELLRVQPPLKLKDIAPLIGYDDPYYMSRIFKSMTGFSPVEYRNQI